MARTATERKRQQRERDAMGGIREVLVRVPSKYVDEIRKVASEMLKEAKS